MSTKPRRKLIEQAPTWRRAKRPDDMRACLERMLSRERKPSQEFLQGVVLHWIAAAGDVHPAGMARLVLNIGEDGHPLDELSDESPGRCALRSIM